MSRITSNVVEVKKQNHMNASVGSNGQKYCIYRIRRCGWREDVTIPFLMIDRGDRKMPRIFLRKKRGESVTGCPLAFLFCRKVTPGN